MCAEGEEGEARRRGVSFFSSPKEAGRAVAEVGVLEESGLDESAHCSSRLRVRRIARDLLGRLEEASLPLGLRAVLRRHAGRHAEARGASRGAGGHVGDG